MVLWSSSIVGGKTGILGVGVENRGQTIKGREGGGGGGSWDGAAHPLPTS